MTAGIDDGLNLGGHKPRSGSCSKRKLQHRNDRLELLLNITKTITSDLDLREVLRSTSAHIREVIER